jgi:hypothetical protein
MSLAAVITWLITICFGLFLLSIWLVEYDYDDYGGGGSRLPVPVLSAHAMLAIAGVPLWLLYLVTDERRLAWAAALILACVAVLGLTMVIRWIGLYRADRVPAAASATTSAVSAFQPAPSPVFTAAPAEQNFPVVVVLCHGAFALVTVALVWLTVIGFGGS